MHTYTRHLMLPTIEIIKLFVKKRCSKKVVLIDVKKGKSVLLHKKDAYKIVLFNTQYM
jgi:hypothetical protein